MKGPRIVITPDRKVDARAVVSSQRQTDYRVDFDNELGSVPPRYGEVLSHIDDTSIHVGNSVAVDRIDILNENW